MKKRLLHRLLSVCNSPFLYFSSLSSSSYSVRLAIIDSERKKNYEKENHRVQTKSRQTEPDPTTVSLRSDLVAQLVAAHLFGRKAGLCTLILMPLVIESRNYAKHMD